MSKTQGKTTAIRYGVLLIAFIFIVPMFIPVLSSGSSETTKKAYILAGETWTYRKSHVISPQAGTGPRYQVNITVHYGSGSDSGGHVYLGSLCRADFGDIRFSDDDGSTLLDYWIEYYTASTTAFFWIEIQDDITTSLGTIYIYYGSATVTTTSDGPGTFPFFDDFSTSLFEPVILVNEPANPTRTASESWDGDVVCENTDFMIAENSYISWYRGNSGTNSQLGYETSTNGVSWTHVGNPVGLTGYAYHYVVPYAGCYYMFSNKLSDGQLYMFNVTNPISPVVMNGGSPVYTHSASTGAWDYMTFNPGVAIVNGVWHMLLEGKTSTGQFGVGYAYSTFAEKDWDAHRSSGYIFTNSGNPSLYYIPERNALLTLRGDISGSKWMIKASYAPAAGNLAVASTWTTVGTSVFQIAETGVHIADPTVCAPFNSTYGVMISYNYAQSVCYQKYYDGTLLEFYDQVSMAKWAGDTQYMTYYANGTMLLKKTDAAAWGRIYSNTYSPGPGSSMKTRAKYEGQAVTGSKGSTIGFGNYAKNTNFIDLVYVTALNMVRTYTLSGSTNAASNIDTAWAVYENMWNYDLVKWYRNNATMTGSPLTLWVPTVAIPVLFDTYGATSGALGLWVDWVFVRNHTTTDPAHSTWSTQEVGAWDLYPVSAPPETIPMDEGVSAVVNLTFVMFAVGIVVGIIAEGTNSLRKMKMRTTQQMMKSVLNMVMYIVVALALVGVLYSITT